MPEHRKQGVGGQLMDHALEYLSGLGIQTIRLEADPPGIRLYERLGFAHEFDVPRFRVESTTRGRETAAPPVDRLTRELLPAVAAFDAMGFGDDRSELLGLLLDRAVAGYCLRDGGSVHAYAMLWPSAAGLRLGPWLAVDRPSAEAVLVACLAEKPNATVVFAAPIVNKHAPALVESHGFVRTPSSYRMILGEVTDKGDPCMVYAIANGAMG